MTSQSPFTQRDELRWALLHVSGIAPESTPWSRFGLVLDGNEAQRILDDTLTMVPLDQRIGNLLRDESEIAPLEAVVTAMQDLWNSQPDFFGAESDTATAKWLPVQEAARVAVKSLDLLAEEARRSYAP